MADYVGTLPVIVEGSVAVTFTAVTANSEATFSITGLPKIALGAGFPEVHLRTKMQAGLLLKQGARLVVSATGVTTIEYDIVNITGGDLTPTAMTVDYRVT